MKNIHLLPTDKPSRLWKNNLLQGILVLNEDALLFNTAQNIYITSDEEIKDGEYGLSRLGEIIKFHSGYDYRYYAKIILTTDQDLIEEGVQAIDDEFLEWFVKNPSCERVEVEKQMLCDYCGQEHCDNLRCRGYKDSVWYEIIIPQEEPCSFCEGTGQVVSSTTISGFKTCDCINIPQEEHKQTDENGKPITYWGGKKEPKQETLEEAAKEGYNNMPFGIGLIKRRSVFLLGAKWQAERSQMIVPPDATNIEVFAIKPDENGKLFAYIGYKISNRNFEFSVVPFTEPKPERMYSEEQVIKLLIYCKDRFGGSGLEDYHHDDEVKEWFEQFKNK